METSRTFDGRPSRLPLARAFLSPAFTRSTVKLRSGSATAAEDRENIFHGGMLVSISLVWLTQAGTQHGLVLYAADNCTGFTRSDSQSWRVTPFNKTYFH
jgi:hypothetical protein